MMKLVELLTYATCDYLTGETRQVAKAKELAQQEGAEKSFRNAFNKCKDEFKAQWKDLFTKNGGCKVLIEYAGDKAVEDGFNKMTVEPRVFDSGTVAVIKFTMPTRVF